MDRCNIWLDVIICGDISKKKIITTKLKSPSWKQWIGACKRRTKTPLNETKGRQQ